MPHIVTDCVAWSVGMSVGLSHSEHCKKAEVIEMPFALRTRVGPGKHLLHIIADGFDANTVLCSFNTIQPSSSSLALTFRLYQVDGLQ